ncbi:MAG: sigma-70 family RNA polymerase sigma factor [Nitriliruptorales bacterium]|nr:sigma-70 family RNA polymerase sigma factor [Nitriliruptorales bacterium]
MGVEVNVNKSTSVEGKGRMNVPEDLLDLYFSELGKVRLLTAEDEVRLAKRIERGREAQEKLDSGKAKAKDRTSLEAAVRDGQAAFDHFVAANLRLVVSVASQFSKRSSLELGELIQEGNLGLLRAVEKFDWRRGYKFSTYATWWIRQAIQRGVAGSERTIRLPVALHDALVKVRAASARLESETGREPTIEELAEATRLTPEKVERAMEGDHSMTSLDRPVGYDSDASDLGEFVAVAEDSPAEEVVERHFQEGLFQMAQASLDDRSWYVLQRRYGLDGDQAVTLDALGRELGLSRESVRKIENTALARLQQELSTAA